VNQFRGGGGKMDWWERAFDPGAGWRGPVPAIAAVSAGVCADGQRAATPCDGTVRRERAGGKRAAAIGPFDFNFDPLRPLLFGEMV